MEEAGRKQSDVTQEIEKTLKMLEEKEGECYITAVSSLICRMSFTSAVSLCFPFPHRPV